MCHLSRLQNNSRKQCLRDRIVEEEFLQSGFWQYGKNQGVHQCTDKRIQNKPEWPKDCLFVPGNKVSPHKKHHKVTISPDLFQVNIQKVALGTDYQVPVI